jgi:hypothetical protein
MEFTLLLTWQYEFMLLENGTFKAYRTTDQFNMSILFWQMKKYVFPCSTTPTHKLNLYKATMLVPLCYIFRIPFILYIIISSMTCVGSRFCIHLIYNEYTMLYT